VPSLRATAPLPGKTRYRRRLEFEVMDISVRVKPGSTKGPLVEPGDGGFTVFLQQRAVDGKANAALLEILAAHFGVAKSRVSLVRGHRSRLKIVRIDAG